ncbi:MAG: tRNA (adenosine(37)-N6)-threonylcarbamoyltransferase complex ATPase subunit type 1 TsaE [Candidatus Portnoybacteria bacterium]|nr:tRNA (adenosine(37)-N6)-threonylcarbamoyltransferase complex ATPase subunit type 1 TsaE [Candidatus Portnoybacteria bacterium]
MEFITNSAKETQAVARKIIEKLASQPRQEALVLAMEGELGAGKTTFVQGLAKALGIKEKVLSPTFVIMRRFKNLYHIDCYRLSGGKDLKELGFEEIIKNPKKIVVIEWAERVKNVLPKDAVWLKFEHEEKEKRRIKILNFNF